MPGYPCLKNLELEISNPCNERCVHCYRTGEKTRTGFLSADEVEDILIQTAEFIDSGCHITVTGGEVFLNPQWKDILQVISASGKRFSLFTNGTLLDEEAALFLSSLKNKGLKEVQLSLYALEEEVHDAVTGLKDSCVKTKRALSLLRRYEIPVFISCPVMQMNKNSFHHLAAWADANGIPSCCDLMIFDNADYTRKNRSQRLSFKDIDEIDSPDRFEESIRTAPNAEIVLAHVKNPEIMTAMLNRYPHVNADLSCTPPETVTLMRRRFPKERLLFGTDFPASLVFTDAADSLPDIPDEKQLSRLYADWHKKHKEK